MNKKKNVSKLLKCIKCESEKLSTTVNSLICNSCKNIYLKKLDKVFITENYFDIDDWKKIDSDQFINHSPKQIINKINGPKIQDLPGIYKSKISINLGSGDDNYDNYINVDLGNYKFVDIISDLRKLPFKNEIIDLVASNSVLEHIYDYKVVISEVKRILKKKGIFYLCVPSVCARHHQIDYHRWTIEGLKTLIQEYGFSIVQSGISRGPAHFITGYVYKIINLNIKNRLFKYILSKIWLIFSLPFFLIKDDNPENESLAQTIYVVARKK